MLFLCEGNVMNATFSNTFNLISASKHEALFESIEKGDFEQAKQFLKTSDHLNQIRDNAGRSLLGFFVHTHMNVFNKNKEKLSDFFRYLLEKGILLDQKQEILQRSALLIAATGNRNAWDFVLFMLQQGMPFHGTDILNSDIWYYLNNNNYLSESEKKEYATKLENFMLEQNKYPVYLHHH